MPDQVRHDGMVGPDPLERQVQGDGGDVVGGVGAAGDEGMLVEVADLGGEALGERRADCEGVAHAVLAGAALEGGMVEVEEAFVAEGEGGAAAAERQAVFEIGPRPPAGAVAAFAPPLLEPQPQRQSARAGGYAVERELLAGAMLHAGRMAMVVERIVGVAGPERQARSELVADEGVAL